ncbi:MAG: hypothetical protein J0H66_04230 [Solirubrobacterales bacterium]|nr:hypothetical protein [Solirubrobacterales bacterium]
MSSAPNWTPSKRLQAAAKSERKRIEREMSRLLKQEARHKRELDKIQSMRTRLERELAAIDRFAETDNQPGEPRLRIVEDEHAEKPGLSGAQIREIAVQMIVGTTHANNGIHYRTWYELVVGNGIEISGKDPVAVFLTQMSRSPVVVRAEQPGEYKIDDSFLNRVAQEIQDLDRLIDELDQSDSEATIEQIEQRRQQVKQARARRRSLERSLAEATRSLRQ